MDIDDPTSIARALEGRSLCIHTAGPFQQREVPTLLSACIDRGIPYCDGAPPARCGLHCDACCCVCVTFRQRGRAVG